MKRVKLLICLVVICVAVQTGSSGPLEPDTARVALHQQLLDLASRLRVLHISVRPGCEDFALLAYLHLGRGAKVTSAYITNGESGENDLEFQYPAAIAATRRNEADAAISLLGGETQFLNMPDLDAVSSKEKAFTVWNEDTLRTRLIRLVADTKPDLIVLTRGQFFPGNNGILDILKDEIKEVIKILSGNSRQMGVGGIYAQWQVKRFLVASSTAGAFVVPTGERDTLLRRTFKDLGSGIARSYRSLSIQRNLWPDLPTHYYVVPSQPGRKLKRIDDGLPGPTTRRLKWLATSIARIAAQEQKISMAPRTYLKSVALLLDSTDAMLLRRRDLTTTEWRDLVNWRGELESLRALLLGVHIQYSLSEHILTERQLVFFTIDSISGLPPGGKTEIYFPGVDRGWILNEAAVNKLPLALHEQYRLVSPEKVDYDLPFSSYGVNKSSDGTTLYVFVIHHADKREANFIYRIVQRILFAPRFEIEMITPIARVVPGERVLVRVTNHSRDGVADSLSVEDSLVHCAPVPFQLNTKESSQTVALPLVWGQGIPDGTFLIPVRVGNVPLAGFAARKFDVASDIALRVGIISQYQASPLVDALRRLRIAPSHIIPVAGFDESRLQGLDAVIVDRRALSFVGDTVTLYDPLMRFAENGGKILCLSQDASIWNRSQFVRLFKLQSDGSLDADAPVVFDSVSHFAATPNNLAPSDLSGWIFRKSSGSVLLNSHIPAGVLVRSQIDNAPLVVSVPQGSGRLTYVGLCLIPQLANINPGAFRILANLLSR